MKSKTASLALAGGLFLLALFLVLRPEQTRPARGIPGSTPAPAALTARWYPAPTPGSPAVAPGNPAGAASTSSHTALVPPAAPSVQVAPISSAVAPGNEQSPERDARIDLDKIHLMLRDYHTLMGENPVGTNAEIMKALMGANPRQATLGPPEGVPLNGKGELVDQWGTPYFFHQLSRNLTEVRSAGPDKIMWTADDIIIR